MILDCGTGNDHLMCKLGVRVNLQHLYWNRKRDWSDAYQQNATSRGLGTVSLGSAQLTENSCQWWRVEKTDLVKFYVLLFFIVKTCRSKKVYSNDVSMLLHGQLVRGRWGPWRLWLKKSNWSHVDCDWMTSVTEKWRLWLNVFWSWHCKLILEWIYKTKFKRNSEIPRPVFFRTLLVKKYLEHCKLPLLEHVCKMTIQVCDELVEACKSRRVTGRYFSQSSQHRWTRLFIVTDKTRAEGEYINMGVGVMRDKKKAKTGGYKSLAHTRWSGEGDT